MAGQGLLLETGHADLEELVEVAGEDREEAHALEQGVALVLGDLEDARVEVEPRKLAVDVRQRSVLASLSARHRCAQGCHVGRSWGSDGSEIVCNGEPVSDPSCRIARKHSVRSAPPRCARIGRESRARKPSLRSAPPRCARIGRESRARKRSLRSAPPRCARIGRESCVTAGFTTALAGVTNSLAWRGGPCPRRRGSPRGAGRTCRSRCGDRRPRLARAHTTRRAAGRSGSSAHG
jgi:hypothetical protein